MSLVLPSSTGAGPVLAHGAQQALIDTVVGVVIALALFGLYYVYVLRRAGDDDRGGSRRAGG